MHLSWCTSLSCTQIFVNEINDGSYTWTPPSNSVGSPRYIRVEDYYTSATSPSFSVLVYCSTPSRTGFLFSCLSYYYYSGRGSCSATCLTGYSASGTTYAVCGTSGSWDYYGSCTPVAAACDDAI